MEAVMREIREEVRKITRKGETVRISKERDIRI